MKYKNCKAFTVLEILVVIAIIGYLSYLGIKDSPQKLIDDMLAKEDLVLDGIAADIKRSFDSEDFSNINIASLAGEIDAASVPTVFSTSTNPTYITTSTADWFARVAATRGIIVSASAPTANSQPAIADLLYNRFNRARMLFVGPVEANQQRFLLVSIMARNEQLSMPAFQNTQAWFDAIYNMNWNTRAGVMPTLWSTILAPADVAKWQGDSRGTNFYRLRVRFISLPRFKITVSNSHPVFNGYVHYNESALITSLANTGVTISPKIMAGRHVVVYQGVDQPTATKTHDVHIRGDMDIVVQQQ